MMLPPCWRASKSTPPRPTSRRALADIGKLPEAARQQAADWVKKAAARQKALTAARQYAADTARALGPK